MNEETIECSGCGEEFPLSDMAEDGSGKVCPQCERCTACGCECDEENDEDE